MVVGGKDANDNATGGGSARYVDASVVVGVVPARRSRPKTTRRAATWMGEWWSWAVLKIRRFDADGAAVGARGPTLPELAEEQLRRGRRLSRWDDGGRLGLEVMTTMSNGYASARSARTAAGLRSRRWARGAMTMRVLLPCGKVLVAGGVDQPTRS